MGMLAEFRVKNFKGFQDELVFKLDKTNNYEFNMESVRNSTVNKAMIYGINGSGKSNLGLAMMDLVLHLTDKEKILSEYSSYLNYNSDETCASFYYRFAFDEQRLEYRYQKTDFQHLLNEEICINGERVLFYDFVTNEVELYLAGTETLNLKLNGDTLSFVKYVYNNSVLLDTTVNQVFQEFMNFVNNMLLFYSLEKRSYQGFRTGTETLSDALIKKGKVKEFEEFLRSVGIDLNLVIITIDGKKQLYCHFEHSDVNFFHICSTGTSSLALFFYWYIQMKEASFVFMDEFDVFYHFELAETIVKMVKELSTVQIIMTTHNTDLMSNDLLRPDCYFKLENGKITSLADSTDKELRKAHNLQKMYKSGAFDE